MNASHRQAWVRAALLLGVVYFLIGRVFALPADHVRVWRLAAWLVSGVAFAAHIVYEHFELRNSPRLTALHACGRYGATQQKPDFSGEWKLNRQASTLAP